MVPNTINDTGRYLSTINILLIKITEDVKFSDIPIFGNSTDNDCFRLCKIRCAIKSERELISYASSTEDVPNTVYDVLAQCFCSNTDEITYSAKGTSRVFVDPVLGNSINVYCCEIVFC